MLPKPNVESEGLMISKAKNPDRQRALVLVVRKGAVPAMLLCDALLCGVARQRTPYKQYPERRSSPVNTREPASALIRSSVRGIGYLSRTVILFNYL